MTHDPFLIPKLEGKRFDDHAIPLEVLADFAALQQLIEAAAREEFLKRNPERRNIPKGFKRDVEFKVDAIEEGSAKPRIVLTGAAITAASLLGNAEAHYAAGRDNVLAAIKAAATDASPQQYLTPTLLNHFQRFGRSLQPGESIEFSAGSFAAAPVRFTPDLRKTLIAASSDPATVQEERSLRGIVAELNKDAMSFQLQVADGTKLTLPLPPQHFETVSKAFAGDHKPDLRRKVLISGVAMVDQSGRVQKIDSLDDVVELDPLDIGGQLDDLALLRDGWMTGEDGSSLGTAYDPAGLGWLEEAFDRLYPEDLPLPRLYPSPDRTVVAEWLLGAVDVSLEIDLAGDLVHWHALNLENRAEADERVFQLVEDDQWQEWIARVRHLVEASNGA